MHREILLGSLREIVFKAALVSGLKRKYRALGKLRHRPATIGIAVGGGIRENKGSERIQTRSASRDASGLTAGSLSINIEGNESI